jgi:hypothetical protein
MIAFTSRVVAPARATHGTARSQKATPGNSWAFSFRRPACPVVIHAIAKDFLTVSGRLTDSRSPATAFVAASTRNSASSAEKGEIK